MKKLTDKRSRTAPAFLRYLDRIIEKHRTDEPQLNLEIDQSRFILFGTAP